MVGSEVNFKIKNKPQLQVSVLFKYQGRILTFP